MNSGRRATSGSNPHSTAALTRRVPAGCAAALPVLPCIASAQTYPSHPIRWVVPYPPGGPADILARLIGQPLSESVGVPVFIENRPGASGNLGTEDVVRAPPDGYTLLLVTAANAVNVSLFTSLKFNFVRDIAPVVGLIRTPLVMEVNPTFPAKTVAEFIAFAKANPGKLNMASSGLGTPQHVSGELFKMMAGVEMTTATRRRRGRSASAARHSSACGCRWRRAWRSSSTIRRRHCRP